MIGAGQPPVDPAAGRGAPAGGLASIGSPIDPVVGTMYSPRVMPSAAASDELPWPVEVAGAVALY